MSDHADSTISRGSSMSLAFVRRAALAALVLVLPIVTVAQDTRGAGAAHPTGRLARAAIPAAERPFRTLRDQAAMQQKWLKKRLDTLLPALRPQHGIDL